MKTTVASLQRELDAARRQLREALEQQTATADVLGVISGSPGELEPVFEAMLEKATRICQAEFGNLLLYEAGVFRRVALYNAPRPWAELTRRESVIRAGPNSPLWRLLATKQAIHMTDIRTEQAYIEGEAALVGLADLAGARTVINVPMLKENELIGSIAIYRQEVRPFTDKQIELVKSFAAQAVIAIENTRLLNELRESLDRQTATADILRVIAGTPEDSRRALDTIAETASRMFDAVDVNFRRLEGNVLRFVCSAGPTGVRLREALPDAPLEPTDPAVRCVFDNRQIALEDRRAMLANGRGEVARALRDLSDRRYSRRSRAKARRSV
jgi:GAF domain-containing protein